MKDWNLNEIECARSKGGVIVTAHPFDNLIRTDCTPWPSSEIIQKLFKSRHQRSFTGADAETCTSGLGYYSDLQSLHSEDAITWSVFGTAARAPTAVLTGWLEDVFQLLGMAGIRVGTPEVFLWRRIPHPDTLVSGGPEIDFGISTENAVILGEAKWLSGVGGTQGVMKDKDQIQLRGEFLKKYGARFYPNCTEFAVVGVGLFLGAFTDTTPQGVQFRSTTWKRLCALPSHPHADELARYYRWKIDHTQMANIRSTATQ